MDTEYILKNGEKVVIRPLEDTKEDTTAMLEFINSIRAEDAKLSNFGPPLTFEQESAWLRDIVDQSKDGKKLYYAAFDEKRAIAVIGITKKGDRSMHVGVFGISIDKKYRGKGLGAYLMENILKESARALTITHVELVCFANNIQAYKLYKKMGFQEVGRIPEKILYRGDLIDEIIMIKRL